MHPDPAPHRIGYARVSTADQDPRMQIAALLRDGVIEAAPASLIFLWSRAPGAACGRELNPIHFAVPLRSVRRFNVGADLAEKNIRRETDRTGEALADLAPAGGQPSSLLRNPAHRGEQDQAQNPAGNGMRGKIS